MRRVIARFALASSFCVLAAAAFAAPTALEVRRAQFRELTQRDEGGGPSPQGLLEALAQRKAIEASAQHDSPTPKSAGISRASWTSLGPTNIGGRALGMAIHPTNPSRLWVATPGGGVWTSADRGAHWAPVNDFSPNLIANSVVVDPRATNVMYVATGEYGYGNTRGCCLKRGFGIFKSTDGGLTFSHLAATNPATNSHWFYVWDFAMHPADSNVLLAATQSGIYRSADAGSTWTRTYSTQSFNFAFDPGNPNHILSGGLAGDVASSTDGGRTWTRATIAAGALSVGLAFARSVPNRVFASVFIGDGALYRSDNGGATWSKVSDLGNIEKENCNVIWVDPFDAAHILVGGERLMRSTDAGATFRFISGNFRTTVNGATTSINAVFSPHPDLHAIVADPGYNGSSNRTIYVTTDAGVYRADDITQTTAGNTANGWTPLNTGFVTAQFYSGAGNPATVLIGGTQDNATLRHSGTGTTWSYFGGGDGGFTAVDSANPNLVYTEYIGLSIMRRFDGGVDPSSYPSDYLCVPEAGKPELESGCRTGTGQSNFIAPFVLDPNDNGRLLAGGNSLWVFDNVRAPTPTWRAIKPPSGGSFDGVANANYISAIAVARGNSAVIWVGHNNGEIYRTTNGTSATPSWTLVSGSLPARWVGRILIDPDNPNVVYVGYTAYAVSANLRRTTDGGASWSNVSGNLPNAPIRTVVRHPSIASWLYVGTEVGVFSSQDGGATWSTTSDGPAAVAIDELFWMDSTTLGAATYGRGMWKASVAAAAAPQTGWWWNPSEGGRGYSIEVQGSHLFFATYLYDASGRATWLVASGNTSSGGSAFTGQLESYAQGQTLASAYRAPAFTGYVGSVTLTFTDPSHGTLSWPGGTLPIERFNIVPNGLSLAPQAEQPESGWWWNPQESGRGFFLEWQGGQLFMAGYMYDANGNPVWYLSSNTTPSTNLRSYSGAWAQYANGQTLTGAYRPPVVVNTNVGAVTISFQDSQNAIMTLPGGRSTAIRRFRF